MCLVVSDFTPQLIKPERLLCPWETLGKNTDGLPFHPPGDFPNPDRIGVSCITCTEDRFFTVETL